MSSPFSINNKTIQSSIIPTKRTKEEMKEESAVVNKESTAKKHRISDNLKQPNLGMPPHEKSPPLFSPLSQLNPDLQINIAEYLSAKDITHLCNSNHTFKNLLNDIKNEKKINELSQKLKPYLTKTPTENKTPQQIIDAVKEKMDLIPETNVGGFSESMDSNYINEKEYKAFEILIPFYEDKVDFVKLLLEVDLNSQGSLFGAAVECQSLKIIKMLLKRYGQNVITLHDNVNKTEPILHKVVRTRNTDILKIVLVQGANIEAKDSRGDTALINLLGNTVDDPDILELLLKHGANTEAKDTQGRTSLLQAVEQSIEEGEEACRILLKYVANIEAKDSQGRTSLMWAARQNREKEIVKILLENDADIETIDNNNRSVFDFDIAHPPALYDRSYFVEDKKNEFYKVIYPLLMEKKRETIATVQRILREEAKSDYMEEILIHMEYQQARHIIMKHKKQTNLSFSPAITSARNNSDEDFKQKA